MRYLVSDQLLIHFSQMYTFKYAFVQIMHKSNMQNFYCLDIGVIFIILIQFQVNIKQKRSTELAKKTSENNLKLYSLVLMFYIPVFHSTIL